MLSLRSNISLHFDIRFEREERDFKVMRPVFCIKSFQRYIGMHDTLRRLKCCRLSTSLTSSLWMETESCCPFWRA